MKPRQRVLSDEALVIIAHRFAVLSDPMRLRLIHSLFSGERNVTELVKITGGTQANVSRHLKTLTTDGVIKRRKAGLQVFYSIADPTIYTLCELVCDATERRLAKQADAFSA